MTAEPASGLCSYPAASAIRQLRSDGTAASQLSLSSAAGTVLSSAGSTFEAAHMAAAAASQFPFAKTPTPLGSEAAAADAATAWADQLIDDVVSPGRATTDVAEPVLPDMASLLQCAALQEDADAPRCNSPALGTDQQQSDTTSPEEVDADIARKPEHEPAVSAVFTDEPRTVAATAGQSALTARCLHHPQLHLRLLVTLASLPIRTQHLLTAPALQLAHRLLLNRASPDLTSVHSLMLHSTHHAAHAMAERLIRKHP